MIRISASILSSNFSQLGEEVKRVEKAGADLIHIDVMDGHFVPNITIGPLVVNSLRVKTELPLDVHLMVENPEWFIEAFRKAGSDILTVHQEACLHLHRVLTKIRELGAKAGVSVNPSTPISVLEPVLGIVDLVLVMSVNPGFSGQTFIPQVLPKIKALKDIQRREGYNFWIEVDGGINKDTIKDAVSAGADTLVAGTAVFKGGDVEKNILGLRRMAADV